MLIIFNQFYWNIVSDNVKFVYNSLNMKHDSYLFNGPITFF